MDIALVNQPSSSADLNIFNLPTDVRLNIFGRLEREKDLWAVARTCRQLHDDAAIVQEYRNRRVINGFVLCLFASLKANPEVHFVEKPIVIILADEETFPMRAFISGKRDLLSLYKKSIIHFLKRLEIPQLSYLQSLPEPETRLPPHFYQNVLYLALVEKRVQKAMTWGDEDQEKFRVLSTSIKDFVLNGVDRAFELIETIADEGRRFTILSSVIESLLANVKQNRGLLLKMIDRMTDQRIKSLAIYHIICASLAQGCPIDGIIEMAHTIPDENQKSNAWEKIVEENLYGNRDCLMEAVLQVFQKVLIFPDRWLNLSSFQFVFQSNLLRHQVRKMANKWSFTPVISTFTGALRVGISTYSAIKNGCTLVIAIVFSIAAEFFQSWERSLLEVMRAKTVVCLLEDLGHVVRGLVEMVPVAGNLTCWAFKRYL